MIATPIELISSSTCMCLSYGFYDDNVSKILLLIDFGWKAVTLQVVENINNEYRIGPCLVCDDLSGRFLSSILYDYEVSKIVLNMHRLFMISLSIYELHLILIISLRIKYY